MEVSKARQEFWDFLAEVKLESSYRKGYIIRGAAVGDGWLPMVKELILKLIDAGWNKQLSDIKEKFGGLCFYIGGGTDEIFDIIEEYEEKSYSICEECGEPGELRKGGWWKTLCDKHHEERENNKPLSI